jgi:hypothetical protein
MTVASNPGQQLEAVHNIASLITKPLLLATELETRFSHLKRVKLKVVATGSFEMFLRIYQSTRRYMPDGHNHNADFNVMDLYNAM